MGISRVHPDLADFLARHREGIVSTWSERILQMPDSHYQKSTLSDVQPLTTLSLNALIQYFSTADFDPLDLHLQQIVEIRSRDGFEISEVIAAFFLVRDVVIDRILQEGTGGCWDQTDRLIQFDAALCKTITRFTSLFAARTHGRLRAAALVEERHRLARELHDSVTQLSYAVTLYAEAAVRLLEAGNIESTREHLNRIRNYALAALGELRMLIFELHPPVIEKIGLARAIQIRLASVEARSGIKTSFSTDTERRLPLKIEEGLMRIAKEALNNILKHSQAQQVEVSIRTAGEEIVFEVHDDGIGFKEEETHGRGGLGLLGMEARARELSGTLEVISDVGKGTRLRVSIPRSAGKGMSGFQNEGEHLDAETDSNPGR